MTKLTALPGWVRVDFDVESEIETAFVKASSILRIWPGDKGAMFVTVDDGSSGHGTAEGYTSEELFRYVEDALRLERERDKT